MFGKLNDMLEKAKDSSQATKVFQQVNEKVGGNLDHLKNESHIGMAKEQLKGMGQQEMVATVDHIHAIAKNSSPSSEKEK